MSSERQQRIEQLFAQALELPLKERSEFLKVSCGEDTTLFRTLESLVESDESAGAFMRQLVIDRPREDDGDTLKAIPESLARASEASAEAPENDRTVGPYRLIRKIGEGGMSIVYLAARTDQPFRRQVVIKVIRQGMQSEETLRRFRIEQQVLASLSHRSIARLYDGGTTEENLPYFVMELIEGEPIDAYCDRRRLTVRQRLELFRSVCSAVAYAHRNLVVHRDLKPSNILVTENGQAKLLDFGIAKLLDPQQLGIEVEPTLGWMRWMTPNYASPEQILGQRITTASDIYSLGVLLYKLLTGHLPHRLEDRSLQQIEKEARHRRLPTKPSDVVRIGKSFSDGDELKTSVRKICEARSVKPERLRRRLAGDLDTIVLSTLHDDPRRRYPSVEQLSEDLRRYLLGFPVSARGDSLFYRVGKFVHRNRVAVAASTLFAVLLAGSTMALAVQSARVTQERDQLQEVISFVKEVFRVARQGEKLTVQQAVDKSANILEQRLQNRPEVRATLQDVMGNIYLNLWAVQQAQSQLEIAVEIRRQVYGTGSIEVAESLSSLGVANAYEGDFEQAEDKVRTALSYYKQRFGTHHPRLTKPLNDLVTVLCYKKDYIRAEQPSREALDMARSTLPEGDLRLTDAILNRLTVIQELGDSSEVIELYQGLLDLYKRYQGEENAESLDARKNLAAALQRHGYLGEAEDVIRETLQLEQKLFSERSPKIALTLNNLASVLRDQGEYEEAQRRAREAVDIVREERGPGDYSVLVTTCTLASILTASGDAESAQQLLREGLQVWRQNEDLADSWFIAYAESHLGASLATLQEYRAAEVLLERSYAKISHSQGRQSPRSQDALKRVIALYESWGKDEKLAGYRALLSPDADGPKKTS